MRSRWLPFLAVATLSVTACNSEATSSFDSDAQARVDAVTNCLPNLWPLAAGVLEVADAWQLDGDDNPVDPAGLTWSFTGSDITADLAVGGAVITMVISAYGPNGAAEQRSCATLSGAGPIQPVTSLSEAIDNIAGELRDEFSSSNPFLHGVWSITGGGFAASGEGLLGVIGGATNANELESLSTVEATVTTGAPVVEESFITDSGSSPPCSLTFSTSGLVTDEDPGQEYPRGTVEASVDDGSVIAGFTITFDKTSTARVTFSELTGALLLDLETFQVTATF